MRHPICRRVLPLCLLVMAALWPLFAQDSDGGRRYALLVGVKLYDKSQFKPLRYTENDVERLGAIFVKANFKRVVLMTQKTASTEDDSRLVPTAKNIREEVKALLADRREGDTVVIAFSGHGVQFRGEKDHYFCPQNADLTDRKTLISLGGLYEELKACKAQVKLLLVDACRNDPLAPEGARSGLEKVKLESKTRPQRLPVPGGVMALFSCSEGQQSFESDSLKHGVFFHEVIKGIEGKAEGKRGVTVDSLVQYVKEEVPDAVKEYYDRRARQLPESQGTIRGTVVLIPPGREEIVKGWGKEVENSIGMKFVKIPKGTFKMGSPKDEEGRFESEGPQHEVEITKDYWLGVYEVTQAEYEKLMGKNPSWFSADGGGKAKVAGMDTSRFPVEQVSWQDAQEFCDKLTALAAERKMGRKYRLPTEAEWEYACRGGAASYKVFAPDTEGSNSLSSTQANFNGNFPYGGADKGTYLERTCKVGSYKANSFGLYDMHGNVYEWCSDWYDKDYYGKSPVKDPTGPELGSDRVFRGGSWSCLGQSCRAARRRWSTPSDRILNLGFRVAVVPHK